MTGETEPGRIESFIIPEPIDPLQCPEVNDRTHGHQVVSLPDGTRLISYNEVLRTPIPSIRLAKGVPEIETDSEKRLRLLNSVTGGIMINVPGIEGWSLAVKDSESTVHWLEKTGHDDLALSAQALVGQIKERRQQDAKELVEKLNAFVATERSLWVLLYGGTKQEHDAVLGRSILVPFCRAARLRGYYLGVSKDEDAPKPFPVLSGLEGRQGSVPERYRPLVGVYVEAQSRQPQVPSRHV